MAALFLCLATPYPVYASSLSTEINSALSARCLNKKRSAVRVVALPGGDLVYDKNSDTSLLPASVMKLLTTAVALDQLGPGYTFKTGIFHTGKRVKERITGDLYIKGGGDPKLTPEAVFRIATGIKRRGITRIEGDLIADSTFFDQLHDAPTWSKKRSQRAYDARIGALSVNFNTVAVHVFPGLLPGDPLVTSTDPKSDLVRVVNLGKTVRSGGRNVAIKRKKGAKVDTVIVSGVMRPGDEPKTRYVNVSDPPLFAASVFKKTLAQAGVTVTGMISAGKTPPEAAKLFINESVPLSDIVRQLNRYSNNFMSEQIAKTVAAEASGEPGAHNRFFALTRSFLKRENIDMEGVRLADASGLSRQNRLTVKIVTDLIVTMRSRYDLWPDFLASFTSAGMNGSMKERLANSGAQKFVRAKTGSLSGASNLAGVMAARDGTLFAFAIFLNNNRCGYKNADKVEDKIVTAIYKNGSAR